MPEDFKWHNFGPCLECEVAEGWPCLPDKIDSSGFDYDGACVGRPLRTYALAFEFCRRRNCLKAYVHDDGAVKWADAYGRIGCDYDAMCKRACSTHHSFDHLTYYENKFYHTLVSVDDDDVHFRLGRLSCGEQDVFDIIDGKIYQGVTGSCTSGGWRPGWEGTEVEIGQTIFCPSCSKKAYLELLRKRPQEEAPIYHYSSEELLRKTFPMLDDYECGPVHRHGDLVVIQLYLGQHEWISFNVKDLRQAFDDPGWIGKEFSYGFVPKRHLKYIRDLDQDLETLGPPESDEPAKTVDQILFGSPK